MRVFYGHNVDDDRPMFATVTGEMSDGTLVYTEIEQNADGSIVMDGQDPKLILSNQFYRRLKYGTQTFHRL